MSKYDPDILLDSDFIRNFVYGGVIEKLPQIFGAVRIKILDHVYEEVRYVGDIRNELSHFVSSNNIEIISFPDFDDSTLDIYLEFDKLNQEMGMGEGEAACLALAKYKFYCIASSNLRDIQEYITENNIQNFPTFDALYIGYKKGVFKIEECDFFIKAMVKKKRKIPEKFKSLDGFKADFGIE